MHTKSTSDLLLCVYINFMFFLFRFLRSIGKIQTNDAHIQPKKSSQTKGNLPEKISKQREREKKILLTSDQSKVNTFTNLRRRRRNTYRSQEISDFGGDG
jgi:hypothetical protein